MARNIVGSKARGAKKSAGKNGGETMGSALAALAMSAFAMGAEAPGSTAQASIAPEEYSGIVKTYRIRPGSMATALNDLADANDLHVLFDARLAQGLQTRGLSGRHSLRDALDLLLAGTSLTYQLSDHRRTVLITLAQTATGTQSDASPVGLPPIDVVGDDRNGPPESPGGKAGYSAPPVLQSTTKIDAPTFDLPISIQTVPEQVIQDQNATDVQQALENVSGVRPHGDNLLGFYFTIRGFKSYDVFRDGLKIGDFFPQNYDTANLQTVEVLKGPASFIFGRADPGGVINLVTKKPLDTPYYSLTQQVGSFNLYRTVWDLTGPVEVPELDKGAVSYRFSGSYTNGGQFIDFITNQNVFLAPAVTWKIDPSTTLTVEAEYRHQNAQSDLGIPTTGMYPASLPRSRSFGEPNEPPDKVRTSLISEEFKHSIDNNWAITSRFLAARGTFEQYDLSTNPFYPFTDPAPILNRTILYQKYNETNYSTNLDLTGHFNVLGARNDVLIGADYFYNYLDLFYSVSGNYPINIYNPIYGTVPTWEFTSAASKLWTGTADYVYFSPYEQKDLGTYAQDLITLFDNLHILLGARYDLADQRSGASQTGDPTQPSFGQGYANFLSAPNGHDQAFSPRVGLNYQPVPWIAFYGSYCKSFGQINDIFSSGASGALLPPQTAIGWEGGVKAELLDRRLTATLAFFDITKSNILTPAPTAADPLAQRPLGEARSQGAELDVLGKLTNELNIIASYAHIEAYVTKDNGGLVGKALENSAPDSGSLFLAYEFPRVSQLNGWRVGGGVFAVGNRWGDAQNDFILPAYARLDAFAKYQFTAAGVRWSAQINVDNIANTKYYVSPGETTATNYPRFGTVSGAPRSITASLRVEY